RHHEDKLANPDGQAVASNSAGRYVIEQATHPARTFAHRQQLFVVEGGAPQHAAARKASDARGIVVVALVGVATRWDEIWAPSDAEPVILPHISQALYLLQQIRDEAHRFAINYHRLHRSNRMRSSVLDSIPGLGPTRRTDLVKHFGSVKKLKEASQEEIAEVKGIGPKMAETIFEHLHA